MYMHKYVRWLVSIGAGFAVMAACENSGAHGPVRAVSGPEFEQFVAQHDPVWRQLPRNWWEAPYMGNGMLGSLIRQLDGHTLEWQVGRSDVEDHRPIPFGMGRLRVGSFHFTTQGELDGCDLRLSLLRAEASGRVETSAGAVQFRTLVHADQDVIAVAWRGVDGEAESGFTWAPEPAVHPRYAWMQNQPSPLAQRQQELMAAWSPNPEGYAAQREGARVWVQPLEEGGYATAWRETAAGGWRILWVSVQYAWPGELDAISGEAVQAVNRAASTSVARFVESHRSWWRAYYEKSFFSVADPYWQSFYWNQLYKMASATRRDGTVLDIQGPWPQPTPWPGAWWNLNVQLTYWPMYTGNRLETAESLPRNLLKYKDQLIANVAPEYREDSAGIYRSTTSKLRGGAFYPAQVGEPGNPGEEVGNLTWACHNVWLHYRMTKDDRLLREVLFPILRRTVNYYRHFLFEGPDGRLHLPATRSPEYKGGPDCNYDLALLRWGANALLQAAERLGIDDPLVPEWRRIARNLVDYPEDSEQGFLIARDVPMDSSHRHYSHLLMVYPLYLVNPEQPGGAERIRRSLEHWHSFADALQGYSFTGGASMAALLRDGNLALEYLEGFRAYVEPNTMYREAGPVIETPLSAAQSIHDMLIQSWDAPDGGLIRLFPAVPAAWPGVVFHQWRAEGAFLVSAARVNGQLAWAQVTSLAGEPCRLEAAFSGAPTVRGPDEFEIEPLGNSRFRLPLREGQTVLLVDPAYDGPVSAGPVPGSRPAAPVFGLSAPRGE